MEPREIGLTASGGVTVERLLALEQQVHELRARTEPHLPTARRAPVDVPPSLPAGERRVGERRAPSTLDRLSVRERQVLALMAAGCSNLAVARRLHLSERTVEAASAQVFRKLGLEPSTLTNRRVLAVLSYLASRGPDR